MTVELTEKEIELIKARISEARKGYYKRWKKMNEMYRKYGQNSKNHDYS